METLATDEFKRTSDAGAEKSSAAGSRSGLHPKNIPAPRRGGRIIIQYVWTLSMLLRSLSMIMETEFKTEKVIVIIWLWYNVCIFVPGAPFYQ